MAINISIYKTSNNRPIKSWLLMGANATAAHSRHFTSLCLLSRGLICFRRVCCLLSEVVLLAGTAWNRLGYLAFVKPGIYLLGFFQMLLQYRQGFDCPLFHVRILGLL